MLNHRQVKTLRKKHGIGFMYALSGIYYAFLSQPNLKIHLIFTALAVICGIVFSINTSEWIAVIVVITMVLTAEMLNTGMEEAVNLVTSDYKEAAKHAKDATAGAVLLAAMCSVIVGLIIFLPHFLSLFSS